MIFYSLFYLIQRHSRSEKLLSNGRLKCILNSDGEEEVISDDDRETHAERHARIIALAQVRFYSVGIFYNPFLLPSPSPKRGNKVIWVKKSWGIPF